MRKFCRVIDLGEDQILLKIVQNEVGENSDYVLELSTCVNFEDGSYVLASVGFEYATYEVALQVLESFTKQQAIDAIKGVELTLLESLKEN